MRALQRIRWTITSRIGVGIGAAIAVTAAACSGSSGDGGAPADAAPARPVLVALGDSFSAGEGAPPYAPTPEACRRSPDAWPLELGARIDAVSVEHRACAGARTEHLVERWSSRDLDAQVPAEPDTEVTLVTLTVGGNDIGFGDIVATCVLLTCSPEPGSDDLDGRLEDLQRFLLHEVHPALAAAYPNARILHVGYPHLAPAPGVKPQGCIWMSGSDQRIARGIVDALNAAVEAAAEQSGTAEYLDVGDAFAGHELCTDDPWVNGVGFDAGAAHPNLAGQRALAAAVAGAIAPAVRS